MKISLIIIGYNTLNTLKHLLVSINKLDYKKPCEVVYVDDGSKDMSYNYFNDFNLKYDKKSFAFSKNRGRVFARQKGVNISSGKWLCFLSSNVVVDPSLLKKYLIAINHNNVIAVGGGIKYKSKDSVFEKYLNNKNRGVQKYILYSKLQYHNLLFGNCIIKRDVFKKLSFDLTFTSYGGEELDFGYRLSLLHAGSIIACKHAFVTRIYHPDFPNHCLRQYEYGLKNFNLLVFELKKRVVHFPFLLNNFFVFRWFAFLFFHLSVRLYTIHFIGISVYMIKLGSLCAILSGYYQSKLLHTSQN